MAEPLRHRQTKEAATDMFYLKPPRHISNSTAPGGLPSLLGGRGCGRIGPYIARSRPQPRAMGQRLWRRRAAPERPAVRQPSVDAPQQPLHDRMLLVPNLSGYRSQQPADDRERRQLRLGREPALDGGQMWIELRGHAHAGLVVPGAPVRGARLAGPHRLAERLGERGRGRRRGARAGACRPRACRPDDALAELVLGSRISASSATGSSVR